jgi:diguanylate cyclase (GGDEF)-like protein
MCGQRGRGFMLFPIGPMLFGAGGLSGVVAGGALLWYAVKRRCAAECRARCEAERSSAAHLCISTIESLATALEAGDPYNSGNLDCVLRIVSAMSRALSLSADDASAVRAAALLHNIGRLGVPDHLLHKADALTPEEQEKLRSHPVLGARILASIPFPWPVVPIVRHQAEHWDGSGYPDGLEGECIPRGARILAIAAAYSALLRNRPFRGPFTPSDALAEIKRRSGSKFDAGLVAAFLDVAAEIRIEELGCYADGTPFAGSLPAPAASWSAGVYEARTALEDIAAAQRETLALYALSQAVTGSLHLDEVCETVVESAFNIVPCASCVLFLPEEDNEYLRAHAAIGMNARHMLGSLARVGTYLTGRAYFRGEMARASFLADDLILRDVSDQWQPFRSTLVVPLMANGKAAGTLNLYAEGPNGFDADAQRVMRLLATQAGRAIDGALRYDAVRETANTDALTGLRNARFLREYLERELNRAGRDGTTLAVLNVDVDNFKPVNDRFGHARGDQTLLDIAEILRAHVRNYDLAARYAGDEFVLVLVRSQRAGAESIASKLQSAVDRYVQRCIAREPEFPRVGISVGIALYPDDGRDLQSLLCNSDAAMYSDKSSRKVNRVAA